MCVAFLCLLQGGIQFLKLFGDPHTAVSQCDDTDAVSHRRMWIIIIIIMSVHLYISRGNCYRSDHRSALKEITLFGLPPTRFIPARRPTLGHWHPQSPVVVSHYTYCPHIVPTSGMELWVENTALNFNSSQCWNLQKFVKYEYGLEERVCVCVLVTNG